MAFLGTKIFVFSEFITESFSTAVSSTKAQSRNQTSETFSDQAKVTGKTRL